MSALSRLALVAGGTLAGLLTVTLARRSGSAREPGAPTWWQQVQGFAAEREVELRAGLGLDTATPGSGTSRQPGAEAAPGVPDVTKRKAS